MDINFKIGLGRYKIGPTILIMAFSLAHARAMPNVLNDTLPLDQNIRYGRLPNGFTYYIKPLTDPQPRLYLNFYVKAGGFQEDRDQLDLAHFTEHMAFKGGDNFPEGIFHDLERLERNDIQRKDIRASAFSEFVRYSFYVPPHNPGALDTGLLFFKDIATSLKFSGEDIDSERGVLVQESIYRNGSSLSDFYTNSALRAKLFPCRQDYGGIFEHLKTFGTASLLRYYNDWYRPDLMALTVVGNVGDPDRMEKEIIDRFSDIEVDGPVRKPKDCRTGYFNGPPKFIRIARRSDPINPSIEGFVEFQLYFRDPDAMKEANTLDGVQRDIIWQLLTKILNARFKESGKKYGTFYKLNGRYSRTSHPSALMIKIRSEKNREKQALLEGIHIVRQTGKFGVADREWTLAKNSMLALMDNADLRDFKYWTNELEKHFVYGEALPSDKQSRLMHWLSEFSLEDFNGMAKKLLKGMPEDIAVLAPSGHKALTYTEKQVRKWIIGANRVPSRPFVYKAAPRELMGKEKLGTLQRNGILSRVPSITGATELILNNGVKVVLHSFTPSPGANRDRIMVHGFRPQGASSFSREDYFSAINAPLIVAHSGVGGLDTYQLERFLSGTGLEQGIRPYIDYNETGIRGKATLQELEKLLQLVYLYFKAPNMDRAAFEDWIVSAQNEYQNLPYNLHTADIIDGINEFTGDSSNVVMGTKRFEGIPKTHWERAYDIYKTLFGNARDFTFLLSGDFEEESVLPLVEKYLGNLPNSPKSSINGNRDEIGAPLPEGPLFKEIHQPYGNGMKGQKYAIRFLHQTNGPKDWKERIRVKALGVLTNYKFQELRFSEGLGLYSFGVDARFNDDLSRYELSFSFDCAPEEFERLRTASNRLISEIKSGNLDTGMFAAAMERLYPRYGSGTLNKNAMAIKRLYEHYRYSNNWVDPMESERFTQSLTLDDIQRTARKYFTDGNKYEFIMGKSMVPH